MVEMNSEIYKGEGLRKAVLMENIKRSRILAKVMLGAEAVLIIAHIIDSAFQTSARHYFMFYFFMYIFITPVNILFLVYINRFKGIKNITEKIITYYAAFLMCWASILSLMDIKLYGQAFVYMIITMLCSVFYYWENKKAGIIYGVSILILIAGLPFFAYNKIFLIKNYLYITAFSAAAWLCSRMLYFNYCSNFKSRLNLKKSNYRLQKMSFIDELTGLPNKRGLNRYIKSLADNSPHKLSMVSIIMMDIDFFKQYNDSYGHTAGDIVLRLIGKQIKAVAEGSSDFAARFGGEEFIYVSVSTHEEEIMRIAERIRNRVLSLNIPHSSSQVNKYISISLGTATAEASSKDSIIGCIDMADEALYMAKASGKNRVQSLNRKMPAM